MSLVDAAPVAAHVRDLVDAGLSLRVIADNAGVHRNAVTRLAKGQARSVKPGTAAGILAVSASSVDGQGWVDATETWRKIDWLRANGWMMKGLEWETGRAARNLTGRRLSRCTAEFARTVDELVKAAQVRPQSRRFPTAPLEAWLIERTGTEQHPEGTQSGIAAILDIDHSQWVRWRRYGMAGDVADRLACRAGVHPLLLWPDFYADLEEAA